MPAKNSIKTYIENGYYHVYNRGVEKRNVFLDEHDYRIFLYQLRYYLEKPLQTDIKQIRRSLQKEVNLVAFCLMPNHFHLLLKQVSRDGMTKFLRVISTNYACYFNKRYKRVGSLFQGKYKAALIDEEPYLLHVSRYIHQNPMELVRSKIEFAPLSVYPYSSYSYYLGTKTVNWLHTEDILNYFQNSQKTFLKDVFSYQSFVENFQYDPTLSIGNYLLE